ncbi:hypothetical protein [Kitasatospora sp. NPDC056181]|uniref:hypothetical protein n=1 Tax=Kitasatospora sp. NPDC056181 TaxID=3345737 RepID=UPI0035E29703
MTQDGQFTAETNPFAAAEQVSATLGALTEALLAPHASRHPAASLTTLRGGTHPSAESLFNLRLAPNGPVYDAVDRLGTVVTAGTARPGTGAPVAGPATDALLARYGGGAVRGAVADRGTLSAALFELPVSGEAADPKLRPPFAAALAALASGQQTRQPVELATGAGAEVRLVVPPGFHPLTSPGGPPGVSARTVPTGPAAADAVATGKGLDPATAAAATELTAHLAEVAEELFSGTGPAPRRDFAVIAATLADVLTASGTVYAGVCAVEVDGRPSDATLVVSLARHPLPIAGLATELATVRRHAEVWTVLLPAGPAAVLVEGRSVPVPGTLAADGGRRWAVTSVVEAFVPLPDGVSVLCVQLTTGQPQDWDLYTEAFAELLTSVQFGWDGVAGTLTAPAVPVQTPPPVLTPTPTRGVPADPAPAAPAPAPVAAPAPAEPAAAEPAAAGLPSLPTVFTDPAPADPTPLPVHLRGTPVRVPPADFNPFAPVADPTPAEPILVPDDGPDAASAGTPVAVPPPDFDPFGVLPPTLTDTTVPVAEEDDRPKGTPVMIPPPDFNPFAFAPQPMNAVAPAAAPAAASAPVTDPFGTVTADQPSDPFGTTLPQQSAPVPPPPSAPPAVPAPTVTLPSDEEAQEEDRKPKGTPVMIPPPDFNPFAPPSGMFTQDAPAAPPAVAPENSPFG